MSQLQSTSLSATLKINNLPLDGVIRFLNLVTGLRVVSWAEALLNIKTFKVSLTLNFSKCSMWPLSLFQRYQISHWMQTESVSVLIDIICVNSVVLNLARIWRSAHVSKNLRGFNNRAVTYKHIFKLLPWHFNSVCLLMPVHQQHISAVKKEKNNPMHKKHTWFFFSFHRHLHYKPFIWAREVMSSMILMRSVTHLGKDMVCLCVRLYKQKYVTYASKCLGTAIITKSPPQLSATLGFSLPHPHTCCTVHSTSEDNRWKDPGAAAWREP